MKIGIIGAGIAGLATATRLANKGHEVHVFEANNYAGGKLSEFTLKVPQKDPSDTERAYRFDAGPSLFTMPMYVEDLFKDAGVDISPYFSYEKMDIVCQYFWDDGTRLTAWADVDKLAQEVENQLNIDGKIIKKALHSAKRKYHLAGRIFLEKSLHKLKTWLSPQVLKAFVLMPTFDIFKTMNATHEAFTQNPKLIQFFNRFATYNGSNPYKASGMLSVIPHFEHGIGTFYPKGGMYEITQSIYKLAQLKGVHFHFNKKVKEINVKNGAVEGLNTEGGEKYNFDWVVSNMDVYFTYKKLMPNEKHPEKTLNQERSTSALIFYWGIKKSFKELNLHNIFFSNDYKKEFDCLAKGTVSDDPTVYVNITSKLTLTDAPENCENWFVMVNVPHNSGQDWDSIISKTRLDIINKISKVLNTDLQSIIEAEEMLTPLSIESKTASYGGALYGTSSNSMMSAFLRHKNFSSDIKNLYFCGGSVHPGGGIPLCLLSGKIVSELIEDEAN
jgi:phytoene desaturase